MAQAPQPADSVALWDAVGQVEAQLYPQTATSLPLRHMPTRHHAETQAAGWPQSYLAGNPVPGDGTNPISPQPPGVTTGAPAYDLNGDGTLDRIYYHDRLPTRMAWIRSNWHGTSTPAEFDLGQYQDNMWKNNFAVYALNSAMPVSRVLLFCGYDGIIYVETQRRWYDHILLNSRFALFTHLSPDAQSKRIQLHPGIRWAPHIS